MDRKLQCLLGAERKTGGRAPEGGCFYDKEHTGIRGRDLLPAMPLDELIFESVQPFVGAGIGGAKSLCGGQRDTGPGSPVVHIADISGKVDLGRRRRRGLHSREIFRD